MNSKSPFRLTSNLLNKAINLCSLCFLDSSATAGSTTVLPGRDSIVRAGESVAGLEGFIVCWCFVHCECYGVDDSCVDDSSRKLKITFQKGETHMSEFFFYPKVNDIENRNKCVKFS